MAGRNPIEHDFVGFKPPRERIWQAIRKLREFSTNELLATIKPAVARSTARCYLQWLVKAGHVQATGQQSNEKEGCILRMQYALVQDGFEAPRVNRNGKSVAGGMHNLAMWRCMKALRDFDFHEIQRAASVGNVEVAPHTAKMYVNLLAKAGYLREARPRGPNYPTRYRLARDSGARPPAITKRQTVFDRNTGEVYDLRAAQEILDGLK
ncbi:MAG: hypothetical protein EPN61_14855 [Burkholderiaceae bacterium]|nr:MAG: hypothetical protein EPN61_14855 [Burkholderiaceae bacterium]